jgi:amidase
VGRELLVGLSATELADLVHQHAVTPLEIVDAHLDQIQRQDPRLGAFQLVRAEAARAEAEALSEREDLQELSLAGVPIAIKDVIAVEGEPTRMGSLATTDAIATRDDDLVRRIRSAGAVVIGKTRVPELCAWPWTDGAFGISRNPWDVARSPGGSSGGSAAAVAAAMVPLAHGSDGGGSIRIPAAACGLVGIKPGAGVIPTEAGSGRWHDLSTNGPLATTVDDLAALLAVMADRPDLRTVDVPSTRLRIAVSIRSPLPGAEIDPEFASAAWTTGEVLRAAGHHVTGADPPYEIRTLYAMGVRALAGIYEDSVDLEMKRSMLEPRSRPNLSIGAAVDRLHLVRDADRDRWRRRVREFFDGFDVLVTPTLAAPAVLAEGWCRRSWLANARAAGYAPFTGVWNLAGAPAAAVPAGLHRGGMPVSVQIVAPEHHEARVLSVAKQLEVLRPWPRHAPGTTPERRVDRERSSSE